MIQQIISIGDVTRFFNDLFDEGVNAHPDDDFLNYVNSETGEAAFTQAQAKLRNNLMSKSFEICEHDKVDIYDLMQEIYLKRSGLDEFIPLPSEN